MRENRKQRRYRGGKRLMAIDPAFTNTWYDVRPGVMEAIRDAARVQSGPRLASACNPVLRELQSAIPGYVITSSHVGGGK